MGKIACKFGGTSLADAAQIRKVLAIVDADRDRRWVIVSAPGKRTSDDKKITDLLLLAHDLAAKGLEPSPAFDPIRERYSRIAEDLGTSKGIQSWLKDVEIGIRGGRSRDWVASRGEYLQARIMADALGAKFVAAETGILFREDRRLHPDSYERLGKALRGRGRFVIPGFYGVDPDGEIRTFPRGGSDISGAIVARAVGADLYENWTDVSGFLMVDPRIVPEAHRIEEITYRELRELSYMGAQVLHDEAIFPVREGRIPIRIRNTNDPASPGTLIVPERKPTIHPVVGIAGRKRLTNISMEKALMNKERGFGRRVLGVFEGHGVNYEHSPTGIDTMSVVVRDEEIDHKIDAIVEEIRKTVEPDSVEVDRGLALIATVGEGMACRVGVAARLFTALAKAGINIRMIDQGSSELNIIVGVEEVNYETAVRAIYEAFAEDLIGKKRRKKRKKKRRKGRTS
ncbi:MAG: aspartate kinase [Planctomycetes bacterium]|nr:aspartate kinase [Planctomycetota bacterium]